MFKQAKFKMGYVDEVHTQVLELPYEGEELSMVILLPDDDTELPVVSFGSEFECLWTQPELQVQPPHSIWGISNLELWQGVLDEPIAGLLVNMFMYFVAYLLRNEDKF